MDWLRLVYADKGLEPQARQLAGVIFARFAHNHRASFYDTDATAFLDLVSGDIGRLRRELMDHGYLRKIPSGGNCRPNYRLTFGHVPQRAEEFEEEATA